MTSPRPREEVGKSGETGLSRGWAKVLRILTIWLGINGRAIGRSRSENKDRDPSSELPAQTAVVSHSFKSPSMKKSWRTAAVLRLRRSGRGVRREGAASFCG